MDNAKPTQRGMPTELVTVFERHFGSMNLEKILPPLIVLEMRSWYLASVCLAFNYGQDRQLQEESPEMLAAQRERLERMLQVIPEHLPEEPGFEDEWS